MQNPLPDPSNIQDSGQTEQNLNTLDDSNSSHPDDIILDARVKTAKAQEKMLEKYKKKWTIDEFTIGDIITIFIP